MTLITKSNIQEKLDTLNALALQYVCSTIRFYSYDEEIELEAIKEIIQSELERLPDPTLLRTMEGFIYGLVYLYSVNSEPSDLDVYNIVEQYVQMGYNIVENNPSMWGTIVFPLLLYGSEYLMRVREVLPQKELDIVNIWGSSQKFTYESIIDGVIRLAINGQYKMLRIKEG
jgi:hypothetical protein